MSDTETPIIATPDKLYASANSLARYRQAFTTLQVFKTTQDGRRIEINDDGHVVLFDLSPAQAQDLAALLTGGVA